MDNRTEPWSAFRSEVEDLLAAWRREGLPPRWALLRQLQGLDAHREAIFRTASSLPAMPTVHLATLDDGWGHGLDVIESAARAVGASVRRLGLLMSPEEILASCTTDPPHILGLTVLHNDSEPALTQICRELPSQTTVVAGGTAFSLDPDLGRRAGVHKVMRHAADFLAFLLTYEP
jgi:methylmalonyl-CoA mutase cobalamin-binding subunit